MPSGDWKRSTRPRRRVRSSSMAAPSWTPKTVSRITSKGSCCMPGRAEKGGPGFQGEQAADAVVRAAVEDEDREVAEEGDQREVGGPGQEDLGVAGEDLLDELRV